MSGSFEDWLKSEVDGSNKYGNVIDRVFGTSASGQKFAFIITENTGFLNGIFGKYQAFLFMDEPSRELTLTKGMPEDMAYPYVDRIKGSLDEAKKYVTEKRGYLERDLSKMFTRTRICDLPKDCAEYPDRYLKPGDAIRCEFTVGHHEGIYIGNKEVIHVSSHLDGKDASKCKEDACARVGKLVPNFVHSPNDRIQILIYRIRVRTYDQIINEAKKYAENKYGLGEYGLLSKNCQHFASLCAIGKERLSDQEFIRYMLTVDKDYERAAALVGV